MSRLRNFFLVAAFGTVPLLLSGCVQNSRAVLDTVTSLKDDLSVWKKTNSYKGEKYPSTKKVVPTFQAEQIPVSCRVFAHLLVYIPAGFSGQEIALVTEQEAKLRGADMLLIGGTRQTDEEGEVPVFSYYGPDQPYKCRDLWSGWKFGYEEWVNRGNWVGMGYDEWGNPTARFHASVILQAAFLRCSD